MPSERQVAIWIQACLKDNLRPDALWVEQRENVVKVMTRDPGTKDAEGELFTVIVRKEEADAR